LRERGVGGDAGAAVTRFKMPAARGYARRDIFAAIVTLPPLSLWIAPPICLLRAPALLLPSAKRRSTSRCSRSRRHEEASAKLIFFAYFQRCRWLDASPLYATIFDFRDIFLIFFCCRFQG